MSEVPLFIRKPPVRSVDVDTWARPLLSARLVGEDVAPCRLLSEAVAVCVPVSARIDPVAGER